MCGITGIFYKKTGTLIQNQEMGALSEMLDQIKHRGNDQISINKYPNCAVGFRRLAITEKKTRQPGGDKWVVYLNGEIYNYLDFGFKGNECEVISQGLTKYGIHFVKKLNGMFFILAIKGNDVYIFRDRYGIKPVYYWQDKDVIVFSSEIKSILKYPRYNFAINLCVTSQWLVFNNSFTDETLFQGIRKLDKGTVWHLNTGAKLKYWEWNFRPDEKMSYSYAVEKVRTLIDKSIKRQTPKEVSYGSCLSGGIDSAIITNSLPITTPAFTVSYADGTPGEMPLANLTGRFYDHRIVKLSQVECLDKTIFHLEDLRVGASWPNYMLYKQASKSVKVLFDGAGADELFCGYQWRYLKTDYYDVVNRTGKKDRYCEDLFNYIYPVDTLENRFKFDANYFLEGVLLVVDKLSMAHTIEVRLPFLDNDLVDFCLTIPYKHKQNKKILKESAKDLVPEEVLTAPKRGFTSPDWFEGEGNQAAKWSATAYNKWVEIFKK